MYVDIVIDSYKTKIKELRDSKIKLVDKPTYNDRLDICKLCNFYEKYENNPEIFRCTKCGCAGFNIMMQDYQCPLEPTKWKK